MRRAYGDWTSPNLAQWRAALHSHAIHPIQQFAYSRGKNASDMALVIDAMDLLHAGAVEAFALVSSDADFTPLVMRVLTAGKKVYGFGERKAPEAFVQACSTFTFLDGLAPTPGEAPVTPSDRRSLRADTRLVHMLRTATESAAGDDGWAQLGQVGHQIANQASLDPRNHGYRKLSDLIEATGLFEVRRRDLGVWIRDSSQLNPRLAPAPRRPMAHAERPPRGGSPTAKPYRLAAMCKGADGGAAAVGPQDRHP